jgi:hypothetical protein
MQALARYGSLLDYVVRGQALQPDRWNRSKVSLRLSDAILSRSNPVLDELLDIHRIRTEISSCTRFKENLTKTKAFLDLLDVSCSIGNDIWSHAIQPIAGTME